MEFLEAVFPVSGVETNILLPPLVSMVIGFFTSMGGISGAFIILPFQMSFLGYTSPSVSATNFVYNIVGIPGGVYRYIKEGRMNWPLMWTVTVATLPGLLLGYYVRILYLPDPGNFKVFVGLVLLYISSKMIYDTFRKRNQRSYSKPGTPLIMKITKKTLSRVEYEYSGEKYGFSRGPLMLLSLVVGVVGGVYGIGGGAIVAPFCIGVLGLPVHTVAGATLMSTFLASIAGVTFYSVIPAELNTVPDWPLGALFGVGGIVGMYLGARAQKHVPQNIIKVMVGVAILGVALKYILRI
jgi:uncharacterized membrane protein YfcA